MSISSLTGKTCPYCQTPIKPDNDVVLCSACGMPHHRECWQENQHCTTFGCSGVPCQPSDDGTGNLTPGQPAAISLPPPPVVAYPGPMRTASPLLQAPVPWAVSMEGNNTLIVPNGYVFPPVCIATGKTGDLVQRKRTETWTPWWIYLFFLISLLVVLIIYIIVKKTGKVEFYLDREFATQRIWRIVGNWALCLALFIGAIPALANESTVGLGFFLLIASIFAPLLVYIFFIQLYVVQKIDNDYLWIKFRNPEMASMLYDACRRQQPG